MTESQTHSKGGRPTKYRPELATELIEFFESYLKAPFNKEIVRKTTKYFADGTTKEVDEEYKLFPKAPPTLFEFSRKIGIDDGTLHRWSVKRLGKAVEGDTEDTRPYAHPEFRHAYNKAMFFQREFFNIVGSSGLGSTPWLIFSAKNMIGYRDKIETGFTDKDGNDIKGFVILPKRADDNEAMKEYYRQEGLDPETGLKSPYSAEEVVSV